MNVSIVSQAQVHFEPEALCGYYENTKDGTVIEVQGGRRSDGGIYVGQYCYVINYLYGGPFENCWSSGQLMALVIFDSTSSIQDKDYDVYSSDYCKYCSPYCEPILFSKVEFKFAKLHNSDGYYTWLVFIGYEKDISLQKDGSISFKDKYKCSGQFIKIKDINYSDQWSGTGFALGKGYITTNYHVIENARKIEIKGINGSTTAYSAEVVATDKINDIAILKITDSKYKGFGAMPYAISSRMADVGEDVFVLGYPLTQALGNEIKLTNGIISSRTGYHGDVATYQMSAPVQPGNSGGPMFDSKGNVIGIVVAGVSDAENVGYSIKTSYLKNLIESAGLNILLPSNNTISSLSLTEKVKRVKKFVYYIECSK
jgi:hypothetical protein